MQLPFYIYVVTNTYYFCFLLTPELREAQLVRENTVYFIVIALLLIMMAYQAFQEFSQLSNNAKAYFKNYYNLCDMIQLPSTLCIVLSSQFGWIDIHTLRLLAAYVTLVLWVKVLDSLRSNENTAFYARLIIQTFNDMWGFLFILVCFIVFSCFTMYIHDQNDIERGLGEIDNFMYTNHPDNRIFNTLFHQYLMALGEFDIDHLQDSLYRPSPSILFVLFTFIIQIVLLNMLIAIMGDSYDQVAQQAHFTSLTERLQTITEYAYLFDTKDDNQFLFMIEPEGNASSVGDKSSKFTKVVQTFESGNSKLQNMINTKILQLTRISNENKSTIKRLD